MSITLEEVRERYPLFTICEPNEEGYCRIQIGQGHSWAINLNNPKNIESLDNDHLRKEQKIKLMELYPNLYFYISPELVISVWIKRNGRDGAAVHLDTAYKYEDLPNDFFNELNKKVELAAMQPDKYFWCTECSQVLPREQYEDFVFAGVYCKECAKKPSIAKIIAESHKAGFYD